MPLTPRQRNEIRAHHEHALHTITSGRTLTARESEQLVHDLGHALDDNLNRGRP